MKVTVEDSCVGCGACQAMCEAVFSVEDKAVVNEAAVADNADGIKEAADSCPVSAIIVD